MRIKGIQLGLGVDYIASKMSLNGDLELWWEKSPSGQDVCLGVKASSKRTPRIVCIPWSNIKGCEVTEAPAVGGPDVGGPIKELPPKAQSGNKKSKQDSVSI